MRYPFPKPLALTTALLGLACSATFEVRADLLFDQNVTSNVIYGSGNVNGAFTVFRDETLGLELGLRAKQRHPTASNDFNSNGDGVYVFSATGVPTGQSVFNFDFSINTDFNGDGTGNKIDAYDYMLFIDFDPSAGVGNVLMFDPIRDDPSAAVSTHFFGNNSTANGAGAQAGGDPVLYDSLVENNNLVQQSWNMGFFGPSGDGFANGGGDQIYSIWLHAYDKDTGELVGRTYITVSNDPLQTPIVPVPEPSSTLLLSLLMSAGLLNHRRRRRQVAA